MTISFCDYDLNILNNNTPQGIYGLSFKQVQVLAFLIVFPLVNLIFISTVLYVVEEFEYASIAIGALKLWIVFALSLALVHIIETAFPEQINNAKFWRQFALHLLVILSLLYLFEPLSHMQIRAQFPNTVLGPRIVIAMEICIYLIFLRVLNQQAHAFEIETNLKETELNMLRSQNNPHFLFNTLNLINSEISNDPENAKEIVFDLSDLLRKNLKLAKQRFTHLEEEMRLVELYLSLQQKRFKNRLTFSINIDPTTKKQPIPTLLLQPIVENTIKHAVAPYAAKSHVAITTKQTENWLTIVFHDTGPKFDDSDVKAGDGFRILRETLALNYPEGYEMQLQSTPAGGKLTLRLPCKNKGEVDA